MPHFAHFYPEFYPKRFLLVTIKGRHPTAQLTIQIYYDTFKVYKKTWRFTMKWTYILFSFIFAFTPKPAQAGIWDSVKNYACQASTLAQPTLDRVKESWAYKKITENKLISCAAVLSAAGVASYLWPQRLKPYEIREEIIKKEAMNLDNLIYKLKNPWLYPHLVYSPVETTTKTHKGHRYSVTVSMDNYPRSLESQVIFTMENNTREFVPITREGLDE